MGKKRKWRQGRRSPVGIEAWTSSLLEEKLELQVVGRDERGWEALLVVRPTRLVLVRKRGFLTKLGAMEGARVAAAKYFKCLLTNLGEEDVIERLKRVPKKAQPEKKEDASAGGT